MPANAKSTDRFPNSVRITPVTACDQMPPAVGALAPACCADNEGATLRSLLAGFGAATWFGLNGLLWNARPSPMLWLLGSAMLGVIFFAAFLSYVSRD
jgi:hypothetical protein